MTQSTAKYILKRSFAHLRKYAFFSYIDICYVGRNYVSLRELMGHYFFPRKRVLCVPGNFSYKSVFNRIFAINGYRPVFKHNARHDFSIRVPSEIGARVINETYRGNGKTLVATAWEAVSGCILSVDPTEYEGAMVEKSERNATHDGRILYGPISKCSVISGKTYQLLIDNSRDDHVIDLRVAINGAHLSVVYVRHRPIEIRFADTNDYTTVESPDAVFTIDEQDKILACAKVLELDHGEADVLRDNSSGLIYVVDVTHDASVTLSGMSAADDKLAIALIARDFDKYLTEPY